MVFIILKKRKMEDEMKKRISITIGVNLVLLLSLFFFNACTIGNVSTQSSVDTTNSPYMVKEVIDGDTIRLQDGQLIRYIGINTPEKGQAFYQEAKDLNLKLLKEKGMSIDLDIIKKDQYDRSLAYVYVGDTLVNLKLIEEGLAFCFSDSGNKNLRAQFRHTQQEAQELERGIWKKSPHKLSIVKVQYDAPGDDGANVNGEWLSLKNLEKSPIQLQGFFVHDESHQRFVFPKRALAPGEEIILFSGKGTPEANSFFWGSDKPIWNNDGDTVFLFDPEGRIVDSWFWET
jgi:micrococcal nuclease